MDFSPQQAKAVDEVGAWLKGGDRTPQVFRLFGYAGTGKTTLAMHLATPAAVFAAYTGKAASVLRRKKCFNASTIHSLIYTVEEPNHDLIRKQKERIKTETSEALKEQLQRELVDMTKPRFVLKNLDELEGYDLIVIDEVSMVGEQIGSDLLSFKKKILVLGDPAQLPPIEGGGFFTSQQPDILLTEIHRQAQGNPIINMATMVRQGKKLSFGQFGDSQVISRHRIADLDPSVFDQMIVGLNRTRKAFNNTYRDRVLGFVGSTPEQGDKVICLRNNHKEGLLNGTMWAVRNAKDIGYAVRMSIAPYDEYDAGEDVGEDDDYLTVEAHQFDTDLKQVPYYERRKAEEFDFGYAITCHKAQGSQWSNVFIQNESYAFREEASRWLYTALRRAEHKVTVAV